MSRSKVDKSPQDVVDVFVGVVFGCDYRVEFIPELLFGLQRSRSRFHFCAHPTRRSREPNEVLLRRDPVQSSMKQRRPDRLMLARVRG